MTINDSNAVGRAWPPSGSRMFASSIDVQAAQKAGQQPATKPLGARQHHDRRFGVRRALLISQAEPGQRER